MIDFDKLIDNHIRRETKPKAIGRYYPSEVGNCVRKTWYSYKYPQKVEPDLAKIFEMGNILHDFVVTVLKSEKNYSEIELLKSEMPVKMELDGFTVSGRIDDLILVKASGKNYLVEVKSTKDTSFVKKPSSHHVMQLMFYMHVSGVHNGLLLYISKGDLKSKVFPVDYDKAEAEKIVERFKSLDSLLKSAELPVDEAKRTQDMKWMCNYCEYKKKCDKNEI